MSRDAMRYSTFLKQSIRCPFCAPDQRVFARNAETYLTYSLAPYAKYHLLVIPKRHVESFSDLTRDELRAAQLMLTRGVAVLRAKGIEDYTILVRNGTKSGKSVRHLHYHLIPKHRIGDLDHRQNARRILTAAEIRRLAASVMSALRSKRPRPRRRASLGGRD